MSKFVVLQVLLAATLFVAVTSKAVEKKIVLGKDVKGAEIIVNDKHTEKSDSDFFSYPGLSKQHKITKIVVLFEELDKNAKPEVIVKKGGLGQSYVALDIVAKNSKIMKYTVQIFGTPI